MSNLLERALWTFVQSFIALLSIEALWGEGADPTKTLAVAATASALSALKTLAQERMSQLGE